jgi:hypothetical protein
MSNLPAVAVNFSNGNLAQAIAVIDGQAAMIGSAFTAGNYGKVYVIESLDDAVTQGITAELEPEANRQLTEFYQELAGKQEIFMLLLSPEVTMAEMMDSTNPLYANALIKAGAGKIAYLGVFKTAAVDYAGQGAGYLDADVSAAVTASKSLVMAWNAQGYFFRVLIGGYVNAEGAAQNGYQPNTAANGFAGVVLLSTKNDKGASIGLVLGRKVKYACHIKLGKTANGPLSAIQLYIGTKPLEQVANLDALAGYGFIVPTTYPNKAGYYFGVDNMASTDDYRLLAYGAVVDAAARVAFGYYTDWLESEIDVDAGGLLLDVDAQHLQDNISTQITTNLGDRISGVQVNIDRGQVIVPGNTLKVQVRVIPKGYFTFITVDLGLTA